MPDPPCPVIDTARCSGCGRCVAACPQRIITLETSGYKKAARIKQPDRCTLCNACISACPITAIAP